MALQIKETPVLKGRAAKNFVKKYIDNDSRNPATSEEMNRLRKSYEAIKKAAKD